MMTDVLHGESYKRLAPPRNTTKPKHLQSTQTTVKSHNSPTKHRAPSKEQPTGQAVHHPQARPCAPPVQQPLASTTETQQGPRQSPLSRRNPVRVAGGPSRTTTRTPSAPAGTRGTPLPGARHQEELVDSHGRTARLRGGGRAGAGGEGGRGDERTWGRARELGRGGG